MGFARLTAPHFQCLNTISRNRDRLGGTQALEAAQEYLCIHLIVLHQQNVSR